MPSHTFTYLFCFTGHAWHLCERRKPPVKGIKKTKHVKWNQREQNRLGNLLIIQQNPGQKNIFLQLTYIFWKQSLVVDTKRFWNTRITPSPSDGGDRRRAGCKATFWLCWWLRCAGVLNAHWAHLIWCYLFLRGIKYPVILFCTAEARLTGTELILLTQVSVQICLLPVQMIWFSIADVL